MHTVSEVDHQADAVALAGTVTAIPHGRAWVTAAIAHTVEAVALLIDGVRRVARDIPVRPDHADINEAALEERELGEVTACR